MVTTDDLNREWLENRTPDELTLMRDNIHNPDPPRSFLALMQSAPFGISTEWPESGGPWTVYVPRAMRHLLVEADLKAYKSADDEFRAHREAATKSGAPMIGLTREEFERLETQLADAKAAHDSHWPDDYDN
jgi:hypothetical protein